MMEIDDNIELNLGNDGENPKFFPMIIVPWMSLLKRGPVLSDVIAWRHCETAWSEV